MQLFTSRHNRLHRIATFLIRSLNAIGSRPHHLLFALIALLIPFVPAGTSQAEHQTLPRYLDMPLEYGDVIYRINPQSPKQLYIIGISHRDPHTGKNASNTVQTQMEIFRIGEWLKKNMQLNLLLPEGYFKDNCCTASATPAAFVTYDPAHMDNANLQRRLSADKPFINAEMLLMEHHRFHASQVEDRTLYNAVRSSLGRLKHNRTAPQQSSAGNLSELRYLQEVRTAQILQTIPDVIEGEFLNGAIGNRSALFTIGLNHIKDIYRYIENDGIDIVRPADGNAFSTMLRSRLNLLESGYGVTIIIPRTLADNRRLLQMTDIDRILLAGGKVAAQTAEQ